MVSIAELIMPILQRDPGQREEVIGQGSSPQQVAKALAGLPWLWSPGFFLLVARWVWVNVMISWLTLHQPSQATECWIIVWCEDKRWLALNYIVSNLLKKLLDLGFCGMMKRELGSEPDQVLGSTPTPDTDGLCALRSHPSASSTNPLR